MKTLACSDFGMECDFVAKGKTNEEVMRAASEHVKRDHPQRWKKTKDLSPLAQKEMMMPKIKEM